MAQKSGIERVCMKNFFAVDKEKISSIFTQGEGEKGFLIK